MTKLNERLDELKKYSLENEFKKLTKRIYNLELDNKYLKTLSQDQLAYIHVKLHNAIVYKKPFAKIGEIKEMHAKVAKLLKNHSKIDELDE